MVKKKKELSLQTELQELVEGLYKLKVSLHFRKPVDVVEYKCFDYYQIVKEPMDLTRVQVSN